MCVGWDVNFIKFDFVYICYFDVSFYPFRYYLFCLESAIFSELVSRFFGSDSSVIRVWRLTNDLYAMQTNPSQLIFRLLFSERPNRKFLIVVVRWIRWGKTGLMKLWHLKLTLNFCWLSQPSPLSYITFYQMHLITLN